LVLSDVEMSILENNLFGVDLNEESVEIAKLSLWLRTAQKNRKLNDLSNNIKCGNSLIDDPEIAGEKAFNWQQEFPQIFAKGGFDVIIGNPPYVSNWTLSDSNREMVNWLSEEFKDILTGHWDLFICFISISIKYLKKWGL
jgi:type I restriction-modification system DNA methylase subunit